MKDQSPIIALVSGGMDSLVCAAIAAESSSHLSFLHLNYQQKTEKKELDSFIKIADHYKVEKSMRKVIDISFLSQIGGSSLTDKSIEVKKFSGKSDEIPDSYVPFRNTHILSMAVSWAEIIDAKKIYIGAVSEDSSGYPDCRPEYYEAYQNLVNVGTKKGGIEIVTPLLYLTKAQIIKKALQLKAPLELSWSCYAREDKACGECDSCALRLKGFQEVGIEDPIEYIKRPNYLNPDK